MPYCAKCEQWISALAYDCPACGQAVKAGPRGGLIATPIGPGIGAQAPSTTASPQPRRAAPERESEPGSPGPFPRAPGAPSQPAAAADVPMKAFPIADTDPAVRDVPELRPLSVGEIIDASIKLYRRHATTLIALVAIVVVPVQILSALIAASVTPTESDVTGLINQPTAGTDPIGDMLTGVFIVAVLGGLATVLANAVSVKAVRDGYLGEQPNVGESFAFVGRRFASLLWMVFVAGVVMSVLFAGVVFATSLVGAFLGSGFMIFAGFLFGFALLLALGVSWSVSIPVVLIEQERGWRALTRSQRLISGRFFPALGVLALGLLMTFVFNLILGFATGGLLSFAGDSTLVTFLTNVISQTVSSLLVTPFLAASITILYFDLRVRKEGFDLELMASGVGAGAGPIAAPSTGPTTVETSGPSPRAPAPFATSLPAAGSAAQPPKRPSRPARPAPRAPSAPKEAEPDLVDDLFDLPDPAPPSRARRPGPPRPSRAPWQSDEPESEPVEDAEPTAEATVPPSKPKPKPRPKARPAPRRPQAPQRPQSKQVEDVEDEPTE